MSAIITGLGPVKLGTKSGLLHETVEFYKLWANFLPHLGVAELDSNEVN